MFSYFVQSVMRLGAIGFLLLAVTACAQPRSADYTHYDYGYNSASVSTTTLGRMGGYGF